MQPAESSDIKESSGLTDGVDRRGPCEFFAIVQLMPYMRIADLLGRIGKDVAVPIFLLRQVDIDMHVKVYRAIIELMDELFEFFPYRCVWLNGIKALKPNLPHPRPGTLCFGS